MFRLYNELNKIIIIESNKAIDRITYDEGFGFSQSLNRQKMPYTPRYINLISIQPCTLIDQNQLRYTSAK